MTDTTASTTRWLHLFAYAWAGAFFVNALPHFINGVSGNPFQSPFASPPGEGLSSSTVNVLWGAFNAAVAWVRVYRVGDFSMRRFPHALVFFAGGLAMGAMVSRHFGRLHGGLL